MVLFINTSKDNQLDVFLIKKQQVFDSMNLSGDFKVSENLLSLIEKILNKNKLAFKDLKAVIVVSGPGPFTSLRIAVTVANTMAYSLKIPVVGVENEQAVSNEKLIELGLSLLAKAPAGNLIKPFYNKEPNITIAKKS